MKYSILILLVSALFSFVALEQYQSQVQLDDDTSVIALLEDMGEDYSYKKPNFGKNVSAEIGEDIIKNGFSKRKGLKKAKRQSKHFVCTSCHNIEREDPDLAKDDPQARLEYTAANGLPFLQATTLYGAVNRDMYYNGDYDKKYGDLVKPARKNIREAIQLCAKECAQGRTLKDWELESILAYLWTIDLKVKDLDLTDVEKQSIEAAMKNEVLRKEGVKLLRGQYLAGAGATFLPPPPDRKAGNGYTGDVDNGEVIYQNSCLHCHYKMRYSFMHLDDSKMSHKHLDKTADTYSRHSLYQVTRYGTYSKYGKRSYMPNYTKEKMSEQQLADLRAYISYRARS